MFDITATTTPLSGSVSSDVTIPPARSPLWLTAASVHRSRIQ
jgi:hypothetical protein